MQQSSDLMALRIDGSFCGFVMMQMSTFLDRRVGFVSLMALVLIAVFPNLRVDGELVALIDSFWICALSLK